MNNKQLPDLFLSHTDGKISLSSVSHTHTHTHTQTHHIPLSLTLLVYLILSILISVCQSVHFTVSILSVCLICVYLSALLNFFLFANFFHSFYLSPLSLPGRIPPTLSLFSVYLCLNISVSLSIPFCLILIFNFYIPISLTFYFSWVSSLPCNIFFTLTMFVKDVFQGKVWLSNDP